MNTGIASRLVDDVGTLEVRALTAAYRARTLSPSQVIASVYQRIDAHGDNAVFTSVVAIEDALAQVAALGEFDPSLRLWGIPFAVKDNIDVSGLATTLACPSAAYSPVHDAQAVAALRAAGAIVIGKTNLDQFATGLSGVRSPYGTPRSAFGGDLVPGGSSSGSGIAVSAGLVSFALGTDTAGSGRVPAAMGSVVGIKPSRGLVSTRGVYPACASLDCVSVFSLSVEDGSLVLGEMAGYDAADPHSRELPVALEKTEARTLKGTRLAVPADVDASFFGEGEYRERWHAVLDVLRGCGVEIVSLPMDDFYEAGEMLYGGPWLAERYAAVAGLLAADDVHGTVRSIVAPGAQVSGADVFVAQARLEQLRRSVAAVLSSVDALLTPGTPGACTVRQMMEEPVSLNSRLGRFTAFTNLLDLAAVALPVDVVDSIPFGVSLQAVAGTDRSLIDLAAILSRQFDAPRGATGRAAWAGEVAGDPLGATVADSLLPDTRALLAVAGAHRRGYPLHQDLLEAGAVYSHTDWTRPEYRMYALIEPSPSRPGLVRVDKDGASIEVEVYSVGYDGLGRILAAIPAPLGLSRMDLKRSGPCVGFVCSQHAVASARDITAFGSWPRYVARRGSQNSPD